MDVEIAVRLVYMLGEAIPVSKVKNICYITLSRQQV